jgi:SAM-dependent methyltransferase/sulfatase maturation enzyme AslB (radical SAM superfamily)
MHDQVKDYYGKVLQKTQDLKTGACCAGDNIPAYLKKILAEIHGEVLDRFYGCGLIAPQLLEGMRILDLGCGAGRDVYVLSRLVGENGHVVGVDMTPEQLKVAEKYIDYHTEKFNYSNPNVEFKLGYIEKLDALGLEDNSFDVIVSNCVINLSMDKTAVFREAFRVLKPGGEMYFSDVYADKRIVPDLVKDPVLYGECLSGALYWNDFLQLAKKAGFADPRLVEDRPIPLENEKIKNLIGHINFYSATYRLFKIQELEPDCEDFGQSVIYQGGVPRQEDCFILDKEHQIAKGKQFAVCGNTYRMLNETRFAKHFDFKGDWSKHKGIFDCCGQSVPFGSDCCDTVEDRTCCPEVKEDSLETKDTHDAEKKNLPGYIQPHALKELWFHTGTVCNLSCSFCFEDSKPGDTRLDRLTFADAKPFIDEAVELGVQRFSFTGGEPFVVKDLIRILDYALNSRPCLVLTNGTNPLLKRLDKIEPLNIKPHTLSFRISLDHSEEANHDKYRGKGNFLKALKSIQELHARGFKVSVARQFKKGEHSNSVESAFRKLFQEHGLPENLYLTSFPDLLKPGSEPQVPNISEDCMTRYHSEESRKEFMCAYSKMVIKKNSAMHVISCTLVDDDDQYTMGQSLRESMDKLIYLDHHRCFGCFSSGVSCSEG